MFNQCNIECVPLAPKPSEPVFLFFLEAHSHLLIYLYTGAGFISQAVLQFPQSFLFFILSLGAEYADV